MSKIRLNLLLLLILPLVIRIINYNLDRIHGDDLMTAYFSDHLNFSQLNPFAGIPIPATDWEAQFAPSFFILQKIFFMIFGANLLTIKLSILPYVFITSLMIYLITKTLISEKTAKIAVFLYSFFAFNIYVETVGLWIISGSAVFLVFFYFLIKYLKTESSFLAGIVGILCGTSFLFYFSGYAALPVMLLTFLIQIIVVRNRTIIKNFLCAIIGFVLILSPFVTYAMNNNNYFIQRAGQMSLFSPDGIHISDYKIPNAEKIIQFKNNSILMISSLYEYGLGGHGGVNFGNFALFDRFSFYLLILGLFTSLYFILKKYFVLLLFYFVILLSFIPFAFSIPPPAYHRFALAIPFLNILSALPLYLILSVKKTRLFIKYLTIFILLIVYAFVNQSYFQATTAKENYNTTLRVTEYINKNFPGRSVHNAAYPGFIFDKIYYFSREKNAKKVDIEYHATYLKNFNYNEKYVYAIIFPEDFDEDFMNIDPQGKLIKFNNDYSLFVN